jgi:hypothetical protein
MILADGTFVEEIPSEQLFKGLRPFEKLPRNNKFLTQCDGAVGIEGALETLEDLNPITLDTSEIADYDTFPPQIFCFPSVIIVAGKIEIYIYDGATLTKVLTVSAGIAWSAISVGNYVYMSNGVVAVRRTPGLVWETTVDLPFGSAICNYNGQIIVGSPNMSQV